MSPLDLALEYMNIFFSGVKIETLANIFAKDLVFEGPFHRFTSADDYIKALLSEPPVECEYKLLKTFENKSDVCLVYQFFKLGVSATMAQVFETKNGKITKILLLFDTGRFL